MSEIRHITFSLGLGSSRQFPFSPTEFALCGAILSHRERVLAFTVVEREVHVLVNTCGMCELIYVTAVANALNPHRALGVEAARRLLGLNPNGTHP